MFSTVMESGDHGPFNSWDRQVYSHELLPNGTFNVIKDYDEITQNFFIGNYYGQEAIDNDDGSAYYVRGGDKTRCMPLSFAPRWR